MINTSSLKEALEIQEKIETLQARRNQLLADIQEDASAGDEAAIPASPTPAKRRGSKSKPAKKAAPVAKAKAPAKKAAPAKAAKKGKSNRRPPFAGSKRPSSPSGPLAPAVVKVLKRLRRPAKVAEIYEELLKDNYVFTSSNPKTSLNARIYRLKGVKTLGEGKFTVA